MPYRKKWSNHDKTSPLTPHRATCIIPTATFTECCTGSDTDITALRGDVLNDQLADGMIENVIGHFELPLEVATNKPVL